MSRQRSQKTYQTCSYEDTLAFGRVLAQILRAGDTLALSGDLGAGKTALTFGIAQGLGLKSSVSSPTFPLLFEHEAGKRGIPLYHFDAYRLSGSDEWLEAGFDEYLGSDGISVIEWADRVADVLPQDRIDLSLRSISPQDRVLILTIDTTRLPGLAGLTVWQRENEAKTETDNQNDRYSCKQTGQSSGV